MWHFQDGLAIFQVLLVDAVFCDSTWIPEENTFLREFCRPTVENQKQQVLKSDFITEQIHSEPTGRKEHIMDSEYQILF